MKIEGPSPVGKIPEPDFDPKRRPPASERGEKLPPRKPAAKTDKIHFPTDKVDISGKPSEDETD